MTIRSHNNSTHHKSHLSLILVVLLIYNIYTHIIYIHVYDGINPPIPFYWLECVINRDVSSIKTIRISYSALKFKPALQVLYEGNVIGSHPVGETSGVRPGVFGEIPVSF